MHACTFIHMYTYIHIHNPCRRFARIAQPVPPDMAAPPAANGAAAPVAVGVQPKDLEVALHPVDSENLQCEVALGRVDSRAPLREAGGPDQLCNSSGH